jgi:hypothetical protein
LTIPFPSDDAVDLVPPDAAGAQAMAEAVASVVAGHDGLWPLQEQLIAALFPAMTGHTVDVTSRPALTVTEAAAVLARRNRQFRSRAVQITLLCALVRHPIPPDVVDAIESFARTLGVEDGMVRVAHELSEGSLALAAQDFVRNGYEGSWDDAASAASVHSRRVLQAWELSVEDPELAARWAALESLGSDTLGRKVWELYQARGFRFPGTPGSAPPLLAQHDWVHVLADYGTTVESEVEVFGFIARANDDPHAFSLLAMVIALFETGDLPRAAGLFEASPGHFSGSEGMPIRLSDAMRRGALCHDAATESDSIDFLGLDWFGVAHLSCDDVRERFHVVPKSDLAITQGSVGPWEPGGISPFQMQAGQAMAADNGIPYDAHGAAALP